MNMIFVLILCLIFFVAGAICALMYAQKKVDDLNKIDTPKIDNIFIGE